MASSRELEQQIERVECIKVRLINEDRRQIRADSVGFADYPYERAANKDMSVANWKQTRFLKYYEGFDIQVLDEDGTAVHGKTLLANVRIPAQLRGLTKETPNMNTGSAGDNSINLAQVPIESEVETQQTTAKHTRASCGDPFCALCAELFEIQWPELIIKKGSCPAIEVAVDHMPENVSLEDTVYAATKDWMRIGKMSGSATIWKWGASSCNFQELGRVRSVFLIPFGFGPGFFKFLQRQLEFKLKSVRLDYAKPDIEDGWSGMCHVQNGKVYQRIDEEIWSEVE